MERNCAKLLPKKFERYMNSLKYLGITRQESATYWLFNVPNLSEPIYIPKCPNSLDYGKQMLKQVRKLSGPLRLSAREIIYRVRV